MKTIKEMLEFRKPFYERAADITVDTSELSIDEVVKKIIKELKANEGFDI